MFHSSIAEQLSIFGAKIKTLESKNFKAGITDLARSGALSKYGRGRNCTYGFGMLCDQLKPIFKLDMEFDNPDIPESERATYNDYKERLFEVIRYLNHFYRNDCMHRYDPREIETSLTNCKVDTGTAIADDILPTIRSILIPPSAPTAPTKDPLSYISRIARSDSFTVVSDTFLDKYYTNFSDHVEFNGFDMKGSLVTIDAIDSIEPYSSFFRKFSNVVVSEDHINIIRCINGIQNQREDLLFIPFLVCLARITNMLSSDINKCVLNETEPVVETFAGVTGFNCKIGILKQNLMIWVNLIQNTFIIFLLVAKENIPQSLTHDFISKNSISYIYNLIDSLFKIVGLNYSGIDICRLFGPFIAKVNEILGYTLLEQSAPDGYTCGRGILVKNCDSNNLSTILIHKTISDSDMSIDTTPVEGTCGGKRKSKKRRSNKKRTKRSKPRRVRRTRRPAYYF